MAALTEHADPAGPSAATPAEAARERFLLRLRGLWRRERAGVHATGAAQAAAGLLGLPLALFLLDWLLEPPAPVRALFLAAGLLACAWGMVRGWWRKLWPFDAARMALRLEERRPGLRNLLVSYVQLDAAAARASGASASLVAGMRAQALEAAESPEGAVPARDPARGRALAAMGATALAAALVALAAPVHAQIAFWRMLPPWPAMGYPTAVRVERMEWKDETGNWRPLWERQGHGTLREWQSLPGVGAPPLTLPEGAAAELRIVVSEGGRSPAEATLHWRNAGGSWERGFVARDPAREEASAPPEAAAEAQEGPEDEEAVPEPQAGGEGEDGRPPAPAAAPARPAAPEGVSYTFRRDRVLADFEFWFAAGDAATQPVQVTVAAAPRVTEARVTVRGPPYAGIPDMDLRGLDLDGIIEGSEVEMRVALSERVDGGWVVPDGGEPEEMALEDGGRTARWSRRLPGPYPYRFRWRREEYPQFLFEEEIRRLVGVVPDAPPTVEMLRPSRDDKGTAGLRQAIHYRVTDDCGIERVWLSWQLNDEGPERRILLKDFGGADQPPWRSCEDRYEWNLAEHMPDLADTDMLSVSVVASDRFSPDRNRPRTARSASVRLEILSRERFHLHVMERYDAILDTLDGVMSATRAVGEQLETAVEEAEREPAPDERPGEAANAREDEAAADSGAAE